MNIAKYDCCSNSYRNPSDLQIYQSSVLDRQTSVAAVRNLERQLSDCSSATLQPSRQASVVSTASTVKMTSQLSYQSDFDENEIRDILYENKRVPKAEYVCHICHVPGDHMIQDCPKVCRRALLFFFYLTYIPIAALRVPSGDTVPGT
jgi:hypothetical protein